MGRTFIVMSEEYYTCNVMEHIAEECESLMCVHRQFGKSAVVIECSFSWPGDNTLEFVRENWDVEPDAIGDLYAAIVASPESTYRLISVCNDGTIATYGTLEIPGLTPYAKTQICWR